MFGKILAAGCVGLCLVSGCVSNNKPETETPELVKPDSAIREGVGIADFEKMMKESGAILVDVRTPAEFSENHIAGAININVQNPNFATEIAKLDKGKHILLYCKSGARTRMACKVMEEQKRRNYDWLRDGISGWAAEGKPVVSGN